MVVKTGTSAGELIEGESGADTLEGLGGNDTINGLGGDDNIVGGKGADLIDGGDGNDVISGSDTLFADGQDLTGAGPDTIMGGDGNDTISGWGNETMIFGGAGNDNIQGGPDGRSDTLDGGTGADTMVGQGGGDVYYVDTVLDYVSEYGDGQGIDEIRSTVTYAMRDDADDDFGIEVLTLLGSANLDATGNDIGNVINGNSGDNELSGGSAGDDTIDGGAGDDTLTGGIGDDELTGGSGEDTFVFDNLSGDDTITDYEDGTDVLDFSAFTQSQINNQARVETGGNTVISIGNATVTLEGFIAAPPAPVFEYIIEGTDVSERLEGDDGSNAIFGYDGNDTIIGNDSDDFLYDGQGTDSLMGGNGDDLYLVGSAGDRVTEASNSGDDTVVSYGEDYTLPDHVENLTVQTLGELATEGFAGTNTKDASGNPQRNGISEALKNFDANAFFQRESENFFNTPATQNGTGNSLDNVITGNALNNILSGAAGNDTIIGGLGDDTLTGGSGADVFKFITPFSSGDRITDFQSGVDKIDLSELNINEGLAYSNGDIAGLATFGLRFVGSDIVGGGASTDGRRANFTPFEPSEPEVFVNALPSFGLFSSFSQSGGVLLSGSFGETDGGIQFGAGIQFGNFGIRIDTPTQLTESDFFLGDYQTDEYDDWGVGASYDMGGVSVTLGIASSYDEAEVDDFGTNDVVQVYLGGNYAVSDQFNVGLSYGMTNGLSVGFDLDTGPDQNSIVKEVATLGVRVSFSTATDGTQFIETTSALGADGVTLGLDRDFDGVVDLELTLNGDYDGAAFRTEFVNENLLITLREGNSGPTGSLQISGTQRIFETLNADISNLFDRDGIVLSTASYQWYRNGEEIAGAEGETYRLGLEDVGKVINVEMSYTDAFGTEETVLSETSLPIGVANLLATGSVSIEGTATEGETLSVDTSGVSDPNFADPTTAQFQWLRDGVEIDGATGFEYTLTQRDVGTNVSVRFDFEDFLGGEESKTSGATSTVTNVNDDATGRVEIVGKVVEGQSLSVDLSGVNDLDGRTGLSSNATYVWLRDGSAISGATAATYVVSTGDLAGEISVRVGFVDDQGGSETLTSASKVAPIPGETREGTPQADTLDGTNGEDMLNGLASDDRITGGASDDMIDGGEGRDTAVFAGNQTSYTVTLDAAGVTVEDRRDADAGGQGTDFLSSIEFLDFGIETSVFGGPVDLTAFGNVASLGSEDFTTFIEMYIAYFNRAPDAIGLFFWGTALQKGLSLDEIATLFFDQDETRATYPFLNDVEGFAKEVYANVLGREFDQAGLDFWVGVLSNGSVPLATFMLEIIKGAKAAPQPGDAPELTAQKLADVEYLTNKADLGAYFSVIKGMSDVDNARSAMEVYNGTQASIDASKLVIDGFYEDALDPSSGEFLFTLTGVVDDPFAIA